MSTEPKVSRAITQLDEQTIEGSTNTIALLEACIRNADYDALQEHLGNNQTEQSILDKCLMVGLQIVQKKEQEMECVAPALQLLWQSGAKWNPDSLLEHQMTPFHLICLSTGDHHDLLDLLIQSSERTLLHVKDHYDYTALMYAVKNANINCLRILITHGAEVNIDNSKIQPINLAINGLRHHSKQSTIIMTEIFDLLLDNGAEVNNALFYATLLGRFECMKKLIIKGAILDYNNDNLWKMLARDGRVDVLKCLFDCGIDKHVIDKIGTSLLWWVTRNGEVDAIRYLLNLGVAVPTAMDVSEPCHEDCEHCGVNMLMLDSEKQRRLDPCMEAIRWDNLKVVQMFAEYVGIRYRHFHAIRLAMKYESVTVMKYLHKKYKHKLNTNYSESVLHPDCKHWTLLKEACYRNSIESVEYLLEHGADLNTVNRCSSVLVVAIKESQIELIALLICNGVDINFRSHDYRYGDVLPFEASVLGDHRFQLVDCIYVMEMLLVTGCSCGVFSLNEHHKFKNDIRFEIKDLMMTWNVHENNVKPLKQQCRRVILKHLSPRASKMIEKLPLPQCLIKYLSIPELDDIVARCRRMRVSYEISKTISG